MGSPSVGTQEPLDVETDDSLAVDQCKGIVDVDAHEAAREHAVKEANRALPSQNPPSQGMQDTIGAVAGAGSAADQIKGIVNTWDPLLKRVEHFVELTDKIANVRLLTRIGQSKSTDPTQTGSSLREDGVEHLVCCT